MRSISVSALAIGLALLPLTVAATGGQMQEPALSCPAGYQLLGEYEGTLSRMSHTPLPHEISAGVNLPSNMSFVRMTIWTAVGHPEEGCTPGDGNDTGPSCDQEQDNEELYVDAFSMSVFVPDHGYDQWKLFGDIDYGPQAPGTYPITFRHSNMSTQGTAESVTYKAVVCGVPETTGYWDKSSLEFRGPTRVCRGMVSARICNDGQDMVGATTWELWYASRGNPKNGRMIDTGFVGPLRKGQCTMLTAPTQGLRGNFKFLARQVAGHPGRGILWSD